MSRAGDTGKRLAWARRLGEWQRSGDTVAAFCRRQRLSLATFYYWKRRLPNSGDAKAMAQEPNFLPVRLGPGITAARIEIQLPNGALVRLPADVSASVLYEAIQASAGVPRGGPTC